jgi:hypothetical protein
LLKRVNSPEEGKLVRVWIKSQNRVQWPLFRDRKDCGGRYRATTDIKKERKP